MIKPITKSLSKGILNKIDLKDVIYAEVTPPGAMGNSGGIIVYVQKEKTNQLVCFKIKIYDDEETYLSTEEALQKHSDIPYSDDKSDNLHFTFIYGGMGNRVFINNKAKLDIKESFFIYESEGNKFQIISSVYGVFQSIVRQLQK